MKKLFVFILLFPLILHSQIELAEIEQHLPFSNTQMNGSGDVVHPDIPNLMGFNLGFDAFFYPVQTDQFNIPYSNTWCGLNNISSGLSFTSVISPEDLPNCPAGYLVNGSNYAVTFSPGAIIDGSLQFNSGVVSYEEFFYNGIDTIPDAYCGLYSAEVHEGLGAIYTGFSFNNGGQIHYGWIEGHPSGFEYYFKRIAIETTPNTPIMAGLTFSLNVPTGLQQNYTSPYGITLTWAPYTNSVACQVRGGSTGGTDPHNFIVQGNMPTQLFINGNGLTVGQNYQWKVRCTTGLNPFSGVSSWSAYDHFIYDP